MEAASPAARAVAVLVAGLALTALVVAVLAGTAHERDRQRFDAETRAVQDAIVDRVDTSIALLRGAAGLFASHENRLSVSSFRAYMERVALRAHYPGILGLGFSRRLRAGERGALEREMRAQGHDDFHVWPLDDRAELNAILFLEPLDLRNRAAIGYDMTTNPVRREAMARARDSGSAAASGAVELVQEIQGPKQPGFLIYLPVYRGGAIPNTPAGRRERLIGFAYSPIRAHDFLSSAFINETLTDIAFAVYEGAEPAAGKLLYERNAAAAPETPRFAASSTIEVAGRPWTFAFRSLATPAQVLVMPSLVALAGAALSGLLAFALWRETTTRAAVQNALERERRAAAELRESDQRKDEFLATLSHELRNPLAPLRNAVQLLRHPRSGSEAGALHAMMERQVNHLVRMVDDLLETSRISRGTLELRRQPTDAAAVVRNAVETSEPAMRAAGHRLEVALPGEPLWLDGDPVRLAQIVANLLDNAAKYTPPGGEICVAAERRGDDAAIAVRDNGRGIEREAQARIFDMFTREQVAGGEGGLGIGLSLSRRLAEMHGGTLQAFSEGLGKGSEFRLCLPLAAPPAAARPAEQAPQLGSLPPAGVLVVDDNRDAADSLGALLRLLGAEVRVAHSGEEALAAFDERRPSVVLLDIGMPGMNGYEVAQRIRQREGGRRTRLVALTGWGQEHDRRRAVQAGFDLHLVKPADLQALHQALGSS